MNQPKMSLDELLRELRSRKCDNLKVPDYEVKQYIVCVFEAVPRED